MRVLGLTVNSLLLDDFPKANCRRRQSPFDTRQNWRAMA